MKAFIFVTLLVITLIRASTWTSGVNPRFEGVSMEEFRALLGSPISDETPIYSKPKEGLPDSYNFYESYPQCKTGILDQGQCGSCWAFGTAESFSHRYCRAKGENLVFSPQTLVSCDWEGNQGCNGGMPHLAWDFIEVGGIETLTCFPYVSGGGDNGKCLKECVNSESFTKYHAKLLSTKDYSGQDSMMEAIYNDGPITGTFNVYADFMNYTSGVYQYKSGALEGGHAILIRGWGVTNDDAKTPYWICDNSWGYTWGMKGSFWILRGSNECGIESGACAGLPK
ncbi:hypothetical protein M0811_09655 [Anaeramoeba ignava]|uniref:Peptidase C1A papain C-terminal domain-containing protein n=1 Tax=Anaeramoeba ignava TaxID=1746090 RepID=A0A9Q0R9L1_ANAIG|nr:hypothetical protein M0811_09655 [Anaeramoeba ignava]